MKKMVRSRNAGVLYGDVVSVDGDTVTMKNARRVWYWAGAASLSELATEGTAKPAECKFPTATMGKHVIFGVCEIIEMTKRAVESLDSVPNWTAQ